MEDMHAPYCTVSQWRWRPPIRGACRWRRAQRSGRLHGEAGWTWFTSTMAMPRRCKARRNQRQLSHARNDAGASLIDF